MNHLLELTDLAELVYRCHRWGDFGGLLAAKHALIKIMSVVWQINSISEGHLVKHQEYFCIRLAFRRHLSMVEGCPEVVEDVGREDVGSGMIVFPQLKGRTCLLQLDIGAGTCGVGGLQPRDAGWHSGGTQGIAEAPNLRIVGSSIGGVVLP